MMQKMEIMDNKLFTNKSHTHTHTFIYPCTQKEMDGMYLYTDAEEQAPLSEIEIKNVDLEKILYPHQVPSSLEKLQFNSKL